MPAIRLSLSTVVMVCIAIPALRAEEWSRQAAATNSRGILRFCRDPGCAGCQTFLASHGPSCSCEHARAGAGGDGVAPDGSGTGAAEEAALGEELVGTEGFGTGYGYLSSAPNMIGDFFGGGFAINTVFNSGRGSSIPIAGGDRRFKISENMSPIPRDRLYFSFNSFQNAVVTADEQELNLNRYTFGAEKAFADGLGSLEIRVPFATGLSANQFQDGNALNDDGTEFGNVTLVPKVALLSRDWFLLSTGVGLNFPTAQDGSFDTTTIENDAFHLMPFLGFLVLPSDLCYVIGFVQADFDANGYTVRDSGTLVGRLQDQNLLHLDLTIGRWIYRDDAGRLTGIAPQIELHYSTTMQDADAVGQFSPNPIFNNFNRMDSLALTCGINFQFFNTSTLTVGGVAPLRGANDFGDKQYDAELQVMFNRGF